MDAIIEGVSAFLTKWAISLGQILVSAVFIMWASTYLGWRQGGRWFFSALEGGTTGDWDYADDEIVVLAEVPKDA